jgi:hypothetical protein
MLPFEQTSSIEPRGSQYQMPAAIKRTVPSTITTGIAVSNAGGNQTNCTIDNNAIHGAAGVTDAAGCRIANNRFFDPGFVNAASAPYDFHLKANSPTVRNTEGVPVTAQDFDGNARSATGDDFGAYSLSNRK